MPGPLGAVGALNAECSTFDMGVVVFGVVKVGQPNLEDGAFAYFLIVTF